MKQSAFGIVRSGNGTPANGTSANGAPANGTRANGNHALEPRPAGAAPWLHGGCAGLHIGIIMDGNGRWARRRGLPRLAGHRAGATAVRKVVEAAPDLGVGTLTLYAFSGDNWKRPPDEVGGLMRLLDRYLRSEAEELRANGVRLV